MQAPEFLEIPASIDFSEETLNLFHAQAWERIQRKMKEMGLGNNSEEGW